jgi:hypothetical protein
MLTLVTGTQRSVLGLPCKERSRGERCQTFGAEDRAWVYIHRGFGLTKTTFFSSLQCTLRFTFASYHSHSSKLASHTNVLSREELFMNILETIVMKAKTKMKNEQTRVSKS